MAGYQTRQSKNLGRHLVATHPFAAGEAVLQQEPFAFVLYDDHVPVRCDYCCCLCEQPLRCSKSKLARYCSREHQKKAWKAGFNVESGGLAALYPKVPPATIRLAARCLWRRNRDSSQNPETSASSSFKQVEQLQHHWEQLDPKRKLLYAQMAALTQHYMAAAATACVPADGAANGQSSRTGTEANVSENQASNATKESTTKEIALLLARRVHLRMLPTSLPNLASSLADSRGVSWLTITGCSSVVVGRSQQSSAEHQCG